MKDLYTVKEVVELAGISRALLSRDVKNGKIKAIHFGRNVRFERADVERYIEEKKNSRWREFHCASKKDITPQKNSVNDSESADGQ